MLGVTTLGLEAPPAAPNGAQAADPTSIEQVCPVYWQCSKQNVICRLVRVDGPNDNMAKAVSLTLQVLATIQGALSIDTPTRTHSEGLLRKWENDAAPGFLVSLLRIVEQKESIAEALRLLAVVIAKNAVGSSWRKTLGTRCDFEAKASVQLCSRAPALARMLYSMHRKLHPCRCV
jgi:Importin-beta N-terminal domain